MMFYCDIISLFQTLFNILSLLSREDNPGFSFLITICNNIKKNAFTFSLIIHYISRVRLK